jgi:hypothetical protein
MQNELEDMKNLWQGAAAQPDLDAQQLENLLKMRSKSAFEKIRRNLMLEVGLGLVLIALLMVAIFYSPTETARLSTIQVLFVGLPVAIFYFYALQNLKNGLSFMGNLKDNLTQSIAFWKQALRIYFWYGVLTLPIIFIAVRWWRSSMMETEHLLFFTGSAAVIAVKMLAAWALFAAALWGMIHFSYAQWVKRLEKCLEEVQG